MRPAITIPKPTDPKYGFLALDSYHPFLIEEKVWPTITHFMLAKQFEGTMLEDEIRKAKNISLAKMLSRQRRFIFQEDGRSVKKTVYGANKSYQIRSDWSNPEVRRTYLNIAISSKFEQHPRLKKKLLDTEGMSITDLQEPELGKILETIRDDYLAKTRSRILDKKKDSFVAFELPPVDLKTDITIDEHSLVDKIISVAKWIREIEGVPGHGEMFEDSLFNLIPGGVGEELMVSIKEWIGAIFPVWSDIVRGMPKFEGAVHTLEKKIKSSNFHSFGKLENLWVSIFIVSFIRWLRLDASQEIIDNIMTKSKKIKKGSVIIPPIVRSYRRETPLTVSKRPRNENRGESIFSFKGMASHTRIRMTEHRNSRVILRGKEILKYKPQLIALGGRARNETSIEIPREILGGVEEMLFSDIPKDSKFEAAYRSWWQKRVNILVDTAQRLVSLINGKCITSRIMRIVVKDIYNFPPREGISRDPGINTIVQNLAFNFKDSTNSGSKLSAKVHDVISTICTLSKVPRTPTTYQEYFQAFNVECGWARAKHPPVLSRLFSDSSYLLFRAMKNIIDSVCNPTGLNYPQTLEIAIWAFLTVCPKIIRKDAENYAKAALQDYSESYNIDKASKHLSSKKIYSNLSDIRELLNSTCGVLNPNKGDVSISVHVLTSMAIGVTFASHRKEFEEAITLMRGDDSTFKIKEIEIETVVSEDKQEVKDGEKNDTVIEESIRVPASHVANIAVSNVAVGNVVTINDRDLVTFEDSKWLVVIANATSVASPHPPWTHTEAMARKIYKAYPYANIYSTKRSQDLTILGDVIFSIPRDATTDIQVASTVDHRYVASLIAEFSAGGPKKLEDTIENRKTWFSSSIFALARMIKPYENIAIAESSLSDGYREIIENFVKRHGHTFYIVKDSIPKTVEDAKIENSPQTIQIKERPRKKGKISEKFEGAKAPLISEDDLIDDISRGVLYIKIFQPHNLASEDYSALVKHLERCAEKSRRVWLENFVGSTHQQQSIDVISILDRMR